MIPNQNAEARVVAGLVVLALGLTAGCSSLRHKPKDANSVPMQAQAEPAAETAPADDLTATEAAVSSAGGSAASSQAMPAEPSAAYINPNAPKSYTVKRGDTLWGISTMFLRDPWLWPEVWYVNPQVENPHLIYPGDVLALAYGADGRPQIRLERGGAARLNPRLRSTPLDGAIPALPYNEIAAFLSRPTVLTKEDARNAPHIIAFRDSHMIGGSGMDVYVRGLEGAQNSRYSVMHVGDPIRDPDDGDVVGYQGIYSATALVTKAGDPAKAELSDSARETLEGDRLFTADNNVPLNFVPSAPRKEVAGRIISVVDGVELIGQYQVVVINRGTRHGLQAGNILAIDQAGEVVRDRNSRRWGMGSTFAPKVKLPNERTGTMLVFKTFDRVSYGLIVGAANTIHIADVVRSP
jgi:LysM repeat protein